MTAMIVLSQQIFGSSPDPLVRMMVEGFSCDMTSLVPVRSSTAGDAHVTAKTHGIDSTPLAPLSLRIEDLSRPYQALSKQQGSVHSSCEWQSSDDHLRGYVVERKIFTSPWSWQSHYGELGHSR